MWFNLTRQYYDVTCRTLIHGNGLYREIVDIFRIMKPTSSAIRSFSVACAALAVTAIGGAQGAANPNALNLESTIGGFRLLDAGGTAEINFKGTVLVSGLKGTVTPTGSLRLEYNDHGRQAYFGEGKLVVKGEWRAMQWFGQNLKARLVGHGVISLFGEYDKNLKMGYFWYDGDTEHREWANKGRQLVYPKPDAVNRPVLRGNGG